jgi:hypothetical protein
MIDRHPDVIGHHVLKLKINSTHSLLMRKLDANAVTIARKPLRWRESFAINAIITRSFENLPVQLQQGRRLHACMHTRIKRLPMTHFSQSAAAGYSVLFSDGILAVCSIFLTSEKQRANSAPDQKG